MSELSSNGVVSRKARFDWRASLVFAALLGLLLAVVLVISSSSHAPTESTMDRISRTHRIKMGYIPYYEFSSREAKSGELRGFLIDLAKDFAGDLSIPFENIEFIET